jgi:hypothetical protein
VFAGCKIVLHAQARPKTADDQSPGERTVLLVRKLLALPEANMEGPQPAATAPAATPATKAAKAASKTTRGGNGESAGSPIPADLLANEDARLAAIGAILELLGDEHIAKPIKRAQLAALSFKLLAQSPLRNAATKLLGQHSADFLPLLAADQVITYDAQTQTIGAA